MTAISADRATEGRETANPFPAEPRPIAREIRLPGSSRTYELSDVLRGMGLRWDPCSHAWHGRLSPERRTLLERDLRLHVQAVVPIEAFPVSDEAETPRPEPPKGPSGPSPRPTGLGTRRAPRDCSRTRAEALLAFPDADQDASVATSGRFSLLDITSGLPDDSRDADERAVAKRLADLRGRVKAARRALATTPGAADGMRSDWCKEAAFLARFGVTQAQFRDGVPEAENRLAEGLESLDSLRDGREKGEAQVNAAIPRGGGSP